MVVILIVGGGEGDGFQRGWDWCCNRQHAAPGNDAEVDDGLVSAAPVSRVHASRTAGNGVGDLDVLPRLDRGEFLHAEQVSGHLGKEPRGVTLPGGSNRSSRVHVCDDLLAVGGLYIHDIQLAGSDRSGIDLPAVGALESLDFLAGYPRALLNLSRGQPALNEDLQLPEHFFGEDHSEMHSSFTCR